jgi:hypothetical protein
MQEQTWLYREITLFSFMKLFREILPLLFFPRFSHMVFRDAPSSSSNRLHCNIPTVLVVFWSDASEVWASWCPSVEATDQLRMLHTQNLTDLHNKVLINLIMSQNYWIQMCITKNQTKWRRPTEKGEDGRGGSQGLCRVPHPAAAYPWIRHLRSTTRSRTHRRLWGWRMDSLPRALHGHSPDSWISCRRQRTTTSKGMAEGARLPLVGLPPAPPYPKPPKEPLVAAPPPARSSVAPRCSSTSDAG